MAQKKKSQPARRALPKSLAVNAAHAAAAKRAEVVASARADVALVREKMRIIADAFYDIGLALQRLSKPGAAEAIGHRGFGDLVVRGLGLSLTTAGSLVDIVTWVAREDALAWGREKSAALVELAKATPASDTPASLMKRPVKLATGKKIDLRELDAKSILEVAKEERQHHAPEGKPQRGFTSTPDERARGKRLEAALHAEGVKDAKVVVVARRAGGAIARIDVPILELDSLARAVGKATKATKAAKRAQRP